MRLPAFAPLMLMMSLSAGAATPASAPDSPERIAGQPLPAGAGTILSTAEDRDSLEVTLYAGDLALVRDRRSMALLAGRNPLRLEGVSPSMEGDSLSLTLSPEAAVTELVLPGGPASVQQLRRLYLGRRVSLLPADGSDGEQRSALLVGAGDPPLVMLDERIEAVDQDSPWRLAFPPPWPDLAAPAGVDAVAVTEESGSRTAELTYLTRGLDWRVDYQARLEDGALTLQGYATLRNDSGLELRDARTRLVAGEVNRVDAGPGPMMMQARAAAEALPQASRDFEYHVYSLGSPVSLGNGEERRYRLLERSGIAVERRYRTEGGAMPHPAAGGDETVAVRVLLGFRNGDDAAPLPGGVVRVYGEHQGSPWFLGEDRIDHTPAGEAVELTLGRAFDVTAERVQLAFQRRGERGWEAAWRVSLRNARPKAVTVQVVEQIPPGAQVVSASAGPERPSAGELHWRVEVPSGGEATVEYRLRDG